MINKENINSLILETNDSLQNQATSQLDFVKVMPNYLNKLATATDFYSDLSLINGQVFFNRSLRNATVLKTSNCRYNEESGSIQLLQSSSVKHPLKEGLSFITTDKTYRLLDEDGELRNIDDLLVRNIPVIIATTENTYKYTFSLKNDSRIFINKIQLKLNKKSQSYPSITEVYYIDDSKTKVNINIKNNIKLPYNLDDNRVEENVYEIDFNTINVNNIYITLEDNRKNLAIDSLNIYEAKYENNGEFICKFDRESDVILKTGLSYKGDTNNIKTSISNDGITWYEIMPSNTYDFNKVSKIVSFNTINLKSIITNKDVFELYLKINITPKSIVGSEVIELSKSLHNTSVFTLEKSNTNYTLYESKDSYFYGQISNIFTNNIDWLFEKEVNHIKINNQYFVKGFVETSNSLSRKSIITNDNIMISAKPVKASSKINKATTYDVSSAELYGFKTNLKTILTNTEKAVLKLNEDLYPKDIYLLKNGNETIEIDLRLGYISSAIDVLYSVDTTKDCLLTNIDNSISIVLTEFEDNFTSLLSTNMFLYTNTIDRYWPIKAKTNTTTLLNNSLESSVTNFTHYVLEQSKIETIKNVNNINSNFLKIKRTVDWKSTQNSKTELLSQNKRKYKLSQNGIVKGSVELNII